MESSKCWYVVYTKPRSEKKVARDLEERGIKAFCPVKQTLKQWSDRKKKVREPLFTSYVFVQICLYEKQSVLSVPGILNFVYWLGRPAIVKDREIRAIKVLIGEFHDPTVENISYAAGDEVEILSGPFRGANGVVLNQKRQRVLLRLNTLSCQLSAELPSDSLASI